MSWYIGNGKSGNGKVDKNKRTRKSSKPKEKYAKLSACKKFADTVDECFNELTGATEELFDISEKLEERVTQLEEDIQELKNPKAKNPPAATDKKCSYGDGSDEDVIITIEQSPGKRVKLKIL